MSLQLMEILEINHFNKNGDLLFNNKNVKNLVHKQGERYMLRVLFGDLEKSERYYLGLDNRSDLSEADDFQKVCELEVSSNFGYARQPVSNNGFSFVVNIYGDYQANSPIVYFRANGGSWGPVKNLFLCTDSVSSCSLNTNEGYLLSSIPLGSTITLLDGETISMRLAIALRNPALYY